MAARLLPTLSLLLALAAGLGAQERLLWPLRVNPFAGAVEESVFQPTQSGRPESATYGCVRNDGRRFHEGIDLRSFARDAQGHATDRVHAVMDGVVAYVNAEETRSSYGLYVVLEHPGEALPLYTLYAHLAEVSPALQAGRRVPAGAVLGVMGHSADGYDIPVERAHLHFEMGLRLGAHFDEWYARQDFEERNYHGNFNGLNLTGWDPLDYYTQWTQRRIAGPGNYVRGLPPAVTVRLYGVERPAFFARHPELAQEVPAEAAVWEIPLSAAGLPQGLRAVATGELRAKERQHPTGTFRVWRVHAPGVDALPCRALVHGEGEPTPMLQRTLELICGRALSVAP